MYNKKLDLMLQIMIAPFSSFEFYKNDYLEKYKKDNLKEACLNIFFKIVNDKVEIRNLDLPRLLVEKYFFDDEEFYNNSKFINIESFYLEFMERLGKSLFSHRNGKICLKYWEGENEKNFMGPYSGIHKIALWHSLNRLISTDVLVCSYIIGQGFLSEKNLDGYYHQITLEDSQLEKILNKGLSENHIHISAGTNFYISWERLMEISYSNFTYNKDTYKNLNNKNSVFNFPENFCGMINAAAIIRLVITFYLINFREGNFKNRNISFYDFVVAVSSNDRLKENKFIEIVDNVINGIPIVNNEGELRNIFEELKEVFFKEKIDYVKFFLKETDVDTSSENIFLFHIIRFFKTEKEFLMDKNFVKCFFQYLRIKNLFFQFSVQDNQINGLEYFQYHFNMSTSDKLEETYWEKILKNQFQDKNLEKIELRIGTGFSPKESDTKNLNEFIKRLKRIFKAYNSIAEEDQNLKVSIGIIPHFIKKKDDFKNKCWMKYDINNKKTCEHLYHGANRENYNREIRIINETVDKFKNLSKYVVGIDGASLENSTEPWVFAPIYDYARDGKKAILNSINEVKQNLGFTFHVGEDFRHLLTGLRRVDEVISHFKYHAGDRIGHGIVTGISVDKWLKNNPVVFLPRIEYLEDLLWVWSLCEDNSIKTDNENYLERKILELAEEIYERMDGITVFDLWKSYINKFKPVNINPIFKSERDIKICLDSDKKPKQNQLFCCDTDHENTYIWNWEKLSLTYHCEIYLKKMEEKIAVKSDEFGTQFLKAAQTLVLKKISNEGIIIETNPTSNRVIGEIEDIFSHYICNFNTEILDNGKYEMEKSIMASINSDDPSVFQTSISSEFAYIYYSLIEMKYPRKKILEWIDQIREIGMTSSFIETRNIDIVKKELLEIVKDMEKFTS